MAEFLSKYSRRTVALFWVALLAVVVGILLYFEQVAVLYVLTTIGLVVLLAIVGTADLEKVGRENAE